jgi:acyl carrier protein
LPANAKITNKVVQIIASIKQVSPEAIRMETTFDELGIDSLDRINILFELESEFEVDIPDERARSINSVNGIVVQLADYLQREQDGRI